MQYRLVSDYGWGDKAWLERFLDANQAVQAFNDKLGWQAVETIEQALEYDHPIYRIEVDDPDDEVDWDWMDS
jgi:hypothetical protein